jgi:hypothetical protein
MDKSYSNIVPAGLQDELISIRDRTTIDSWRIGDIVTETFVFCALNNIVAERQMVYAAIGSLVGKSSRTIREYHHLSEFFPDDWRSEFSVLAYDHFRVAAKFGPDKCKDMLGWAVDEVARLNRPATVDAMEAHFMTQPPEPSSPWSQENTSNVVIAPEYPYPTEKEPSELPFESTFETPSLSQTLPQSLSPQQNTEQPLPDYMSPSTFSGLFASLRSLKTAANMVLVQKDDRELVLFALEMLMKALEKADQKVMQNAY